VLVTGGRNAANVCLASTELYDPATGIWSATDSLATARDYHTANLLLDGSLLVAGGRDAANVTLASAELYRQVEPV